jgi:hypothetical protein
MVGDVFEVKMVDGRMVELLVSDSISKHGESPAKFWLVPPKE